MDAQSQTRLYGKQMFDAAYTSILVGEYLVDGQHRTHDHDFVEIALISGGHGVHRTIYGDQRVGEGDVFILRPGVWHSYRECADLVVYNCCFGLDLLHRELAWLQEEPMLSYLLWKAPLSLDQQGVLNLHLEPGSLESCLHRMNLLAEIGPGAPESRADQIGHLLILLAELARNMGHEYRVQATSTARTHPAVVKGIHLLKKSQDHPWSLKGLSKQVAVDPSYLTRLFRTHTGLPPMEYLFRLRAENAATLLLSTDRYVQEIAVEVGWPNPNYFSRRFKSYFGITPTEYRFQFFSPDSNG